MAARRAAGTVERATRADLRARGVTVRASAPAALAVRLSAALDAETDSKAMAALSRELRTTMADIAKAAPVAQAADAVDEIAARRAARRGA